MKKRVFSAVAITLLLATSCTDKSADTVLLNTPNDSLSYSAGVYMAQDLRNIVANEFGIDSADIDDFLRGVRDGFPKSTDSKAVAYSRGLGVGVTAMDMLANANKVMCGDDSLHSLKPELFYEGVLAAIKSEGPMGRSKAIDYVDRHRYRKDSERFMQMNATRDGVLSLPSGLQYKIVEEGHGAVAAVGDTVSCIYKGSFPGGRMFDSSRDAAVKFPVDAVIPGFSQALQIMPEGTICKVYIPWQLGYGAQGNVRIPPYSALVFDLEIVKVIKRTR